MNNKKLKVLFVLNHFQFSDGIAATMRTLIDSIDLSKFEIHLLPLFKLDKSFFAPVKSKLTLHKGFGFYFKGFSKILDLLPKKWLYRFLVREKFDVEVSYQFFGISSSIVSASKNPNKICWLHIINPGTENEIPRKSKCFSKIVTVSKSTGDTLKSFGLNDTVCCYNIIDEEAIYKASNEILPIKKDKKYAVVTVGRIHSQKAILRQLRSIHEIVKQVQNVEFWIVGDGPELLEARKYVEKYNLEDFVKLLGEQKNPYKFIAKADLFFCGSLREGFSTACQEAAILGIPIVSTEVDGANELIEIAQSGRVIPNDEKNIIDSLIEILADDSLISSWKKLAERNKSRFYKKARLEKIEALIENSINN